MRVSFRSPKKLRSEGEEEEEEEEEEEVILSTQSNTWENKMWEEGGGAGVR